ncbi:MAG: inverse autotransporter beta domain-containing protein [Chthoniobacter sp.]|nr:inverse autotransporter beta domain-containing protein [Chthoniobacter sp.]
MHKPLATTIALTLGFIALAIPGATSAGQPLYGPTGQEGKGKTISPLDPVPGTITLGGEFSNHLQGIYLDSVTPFWHPGDATIFLSTRSKYDDSHQYDTNYGLGLRYLVPGRDVILGVNAFYDSLDSQFDNQFHSAGFGAEILTRWVDARFNYYLPASDDILAGTTRRRSSSTTVTGPVQNGSVLQTTTTTRTRKQTFRNYEAFLEGWNAEAGFLIPGLDRYMETRVFGGYYHYNNPFKSDYEGFKARLEAHFLPGVIGNVEWWNDSHLNGGHWTTDVHVSVPFSIFNLAKGRNPFEGASESFRPRQREFRERLSDMVVRSHRVKTVKSGDIETSDKTSTQTRTTTTNVSTVAPPTPPPFTPPPIG